MKKRIYQIAIVFLSLSILTISVGAAQSNYMPCQPKWVQCLIRQLECRDAMRSAPTANTCPTRPIEQPPAAQQPAEKPTEEQPPIETQPTEPPSEPEAGNSIQPYEMEVVSLINDIRLGYGLKALAPSEKLCDIARVKSEDMKQNRYFTHNSPTYGSPFEMLKYFGVSYRSAGENIAYGYRSPSAVVEAWMNSQGHRDNILNPSFTEIGVGYVQEGHYWTQLFTA